MAKKTFLITGATSGLGAGTALALAKAGHHVTVTGETWQQVREFRDVAEKAKAKLTVIKLDLLDDIDIAHAAQVDADIIVLNAGLQESGAIVDIPLERMRESFEINVFGHLQLVQAIAPRLVAKKKGMFVWLSSIAGLQPVPFLGAYSATKHAIEGIAGAMKLELAPLGIKVATIAPGVFGTGFNDTGAESMQQWHDPKSALVPVPPMGPLLAHQANPQEMIDAIVDTLTSSKPAYRTMRPEATAKAAKAAQAEQWVAKA